MSNFMILLKTFSHSKKVQEKSELFLRYHFQEVRNVIYQLLNGNCLTWKDIIVLKSFQMKHTTKIGVTSHFSKSCT